ncbi:hypothetical protein C0J52_17017 [Blattella germanica]|nr:hypothetical protein C0J52_17017 [Blattella germanica]
MKKLKKEIIINTSITSQITLAANLCQSDIHDNNLQYKSNLLNFSTEIGNIRLAYIRNRKYTILWIEEINRTSNRKFYDIEEFIKIKISFEHIVVSKYC